MLSEVVLGVASRARDVALPEAARYTICSHLKVIYLEDQPTEGRERVFLVRLSNATLHRLFALQLVRIRSMTHRRKRILGEVIRRGSQPRPHFTYTTTPYWEHTPLTYYDGPKFPHRDTTALYLVFSTRDR
jgi:hypothetical protein